MASGTGAHVEDGSSGRQQRLALDVRHLVEGAEQCGDGYLVLVEHRREDTQPRRLAITVIVGNGASHRVADGLHQRMKWVPCQGSYSGFGGQQSLRSGSHGPHGLHALGIEAGLARLTAVGDVPVL